MKHNEQGPDKEAICSHLNAEDTSQNRFSADWII